MVQRLKVYQLLKSSIQEAVQRFTTYFQKMEKTKDTSSMKLDTSAFDRVGDLKNPFGAECIDSIHINIYPKGFWKREGPYCNARIEFSNGRTKADHTTEKFQTLESLIDYLHTFTKSL